MEYQNKLSELIARYEQELDQFNKQRHLWLWASSIVFTGIIFIIFYWEWLDDVASDTTWWVVTSIMLIISINWWYWTMKVIRYAILHQALELKILKSLIHDIDSVKKIVKEMKQIHLDLFKK